MSYPLLTFFTTKMFAIFHVKSLSEHLVKYYQHLQIKEELGVENTIFLGMNFRPTSWMR